MAPSCQFESDMAVRAAAVARSGLDSVHTYHRNDSLRPDLVLTTVCQLCVTSVVAP